MYTLGIPKRDYRRATQVLDYESQPTIPYHANLQGDGFYMFTFPEAGDEDDFRAIVIKLKGEGIRVIGADAQLTEREIMKLVDLVPINEGTCGYSIDGKPADTPAGPHLLRKAIRQEISKLKEQDDGIDPKVKSIASNINKAILSIDPDMSYMDFAKGVAQVLIDEYGTHNYEPFIKELKNALDSTLGEQKTISEGKGYDTARKLIAKLREKTYKSFSDEELEEFSKEMANHFKGYGDAGISI